MGERRSVTNSRRFRFAGSDPRSTGVGVTVENTDIRLSTVKGADRICVMEAGQVVEQGKHADLMAQGGHYAKLVENQELVSNG